MSKTKQPQKKACPILGAHMSVAGGLENAFEAGVRVGCDCLQIFVKNQRQWMASPLTDEQIVAYQAAQRDTGLTPVVAHATYLLNLASPDGATRKKSTEALIEELIRCEKLGVDALVFHPGAHLSDTLEKGITHIAQSLDQVYDSGVGLKTTILLEATAGQGSAIGYRMDQLADIIAQSKHGKHLGVCLDTCHLFAAGYDFRSREGYDDMVAEMESTFGVKKIRCIHTNDSKKECGSRVDRHDHIGRGEIGKEGFVHFMNDARWDGIPFILETPKGKDGRGTEFDKVNLERLRSFVK